MLDRSTIPRIVFNFIVIKIIMGNISIISQLYTYQVRRLVWKKIVM